MNPPLRIWTNYRPAQTDSTTLSDLLSRHDLIVASGPGPDPSLAGADVAYGHPDPRQIIDLPNLRWVHLNTAGYTRYDKDDLREALRARGAALTNSSSVYAEPCAQHVVAMILSLARQLPDMLENQRAARIWPSGAIRSGSVLLNGQTALLAGFGAIGSRLAQLLEPFQMQIIAVRRNVRGDERVRTMPMEHLDELLISADHIINLLPAADATMGFFNANRFARMKPTAIFYNIGRGDTVDQRALRSSLETGSIAAAYLDVTTPEPLPPDDPLWTTPNCYITPHTAGGHTTETQRNIAHFIDNLRRFEQGQPLRDRII